MFSLDILCSNNFLKSHFGESESAVESCVESCGSFTLVICITERVSTSKHVRWLCACAVRVWLSCACVFAIKTMAVRIFRSAKISNFGGIFLPIVHLFRLGSNGF